MKRKSKVMPFRRDRNKENAYTLGYAARLNEKPVTACPNLLLTFSQIYAVELMDAWMNGWYSADRKLRSPELEMKGAK
jgi:ribosome modulation factor